MTSNQAVVRLLATCIVAVVWVTPVAAQRPQLLSIVDPPLSEGKYIASFELARKLHSTRTEGPLDQ